MADVQKYFLSFHDAIKIVVDENNELKEKRDEILELISSNLKKETEASFETFNQGSYAMKTGIKALDGGDYDIDVGVIFDLDKEDEKYQDPINVKNIVFNALNDEFDDVKMKVPCVTVKFENEEEDNRNYHVDFAIYSKNENGEIFLAKGKPTSLNENKIWEESDPKELLKKMKESYGLKFERMQFRRIIRYLKRWKDLKFKNQVNRPTGIGLSNAALEKFELSYTLDPVSMSRTYNDLDALKKFVNSMINDFDYVYENGEWGYRLKVFLPTKPFTDVYEKISLKQMSDFKSKLEKMKQSLNDAETTVDPKEACELLVKEFGDDFPIPDEEETAQSKKKAILTNTSSAVKIK